VCGVLLVCLRELRFPCDTVVPLDRRLTCRSSHFDRPTTRPVRPQRIHMPVDGGGRRVLQFVKAVGFIESLYTFPRGGRRLHVVVGTIALPSAAWRPWRRRARRPLRARSRRHSLWATNHFTTGERGAAAETAQPIRGRLPCNRVRRPPPPFLGARASRSHPPRRRPFRLTQPGQRSARRRQARRHSSQEAAASAVGARRKGTSLQLATG
jgi:hypothetical protein